MLLHEQRSRFLTAAGLIGLFLLPPTALADGGADFEAEAHRRMKLSFDLDELEERLAEPAAAAPAYGDPYASVSVPPLPLEPNSEVEQVTVFRDRAQVTRLLGEKLDGGIGSVTFEGLPFVVVADSLNAGIAGGAARIVGVELISGAGEIDETERHEATRQEALTRTEELGAIRDRIESLLAQRSYLRTTLLSGPVDGQSRPELSAVRNTLEYVGDAERDIAQQLREQEERAQELDEELRPLLVKLDNPLATGQKVRVDLDVERAGRIEVSLRYQVWGAGWSPSYNARLRTGASRDERSSARPAGRVQDGPGNARLQGEQIEFEYQGVVVQSTGEDWEDTEILLSTANPSSSGTLPTVSPWYLGRDGWYAGDIGGALAAGRGYYEEPGDGPTPAATGGLLESRMEAAVQGSGAVVFGVPGRRTIAGDGSAQRIPVGTQTFATTIELAAVPKMVPEVFRRARVAYDGEVPLLPGPVATYVDGDYVGGSYIDAVVPGEEFELAFGTDDRVRVDRQLVARRKEHIGPGKRTVRYTFHFRIRVSNYTGTDALVELKDQVPVSEVEKVTVKMLEVESGPAATPDADTGVLSWQLAVADGAEQEVEFRFTVTAPAGTPELAQMDMLF